jgi:hypothetical protein
VSRSEIRHCVPMMIRLRGKAISLPEAALPSILAVALSTRASGDERNDI